MQGVYDFRPSYTWDLNWHHIVGTYDGTIMKIYADGELVDSYTVSGSIISKPSFPVILGTSQNIYYFNGLIDEVRIYNRALSAEEIKRHYEMSK